MVRKNEKNKASEEEERDDVLGETAEAPKTSTDSVNKSEKEVLLDLLKTLKDLGINSIGDLEVRISRL